MHASIVKNIPDNLKVFIENSADIFLDSRSIKDENDEEDEEETIENKKDKEEHELIVKSQDTEIYKKHITPLYSACVCRNEKVIYFLSSMLFP